MERLEVIFMKKVLVDNKMNLKGTILQMVLIKCFLVNLFTLHVEICLKLISYNKRSYNTTWG